MRKIVLLIALLILGISVNAQTSGKKVIITEIPKTVPVGKVWKLERGKPTIVQLHKSTLSSGTMCNAGFLSSPGIAAHICKGNLFKAEGFIIIFEKFEKVQYTNNVTYSLTPISFTKNLHDLSNNSPEQIGARAILFQAGESVFVNSCLITIELTEYNISVAELEAEKGRLLKEEQERERKKQERERKEQEEKERRKKEIMSKEPYDLRTLYPNEYERLLRPFEESLTFALKQQPHLLLEWIRSFGFPSEFEIPDKIKAAKGEERIRTYQIEYVDTIICPRYPDICPINAPEKNCHLVIDSICKLPINKRWLIEGNPIKVKFPMPIKYTITQEVIPVKIVDRSGKLYGECLDREYDWRLPEFVRSRERGVPGTGIFQYTGKYWVEFWTIGICGRYLHGGSTFVRWRYISKSKSIVSPITLLGK